MKCVIMQPTYLPWAGYFNLMAQSDQFVFLDDVQFEKGSWQNRNRVLVNGKTHWMTVPVRREHLSQEIQTIEIDDHSRWRKKHFKLLENAYARHPYIKDVLEVVELVLDTSITRLADLNIALIKLFSERFSLSTSFLRSSELDIRGERSERLVEICRHLACDEYISPLGAKDYLMADSNFEHSGVSLTFQSYEPNFYSQPLSGDFASHLSIVDALANLGWEKTMAYVETGEAVAEMEYQ